MGRARPADAAAVDAWDLGVQLFQLADGKHFADTPPFHPAWAGVWPIDGDPDAVRRVVNAIKTLEDPGLVAREIGQNLRGTILIPAPFSAVSGLLTIDYSARMSVGAAHRILRAELRSFTE